MVTFQMLPLLFLFRTLPRDHLLELPQKDISNECLITDLYTCKLNLYMYSLFAITV